MSEQLDKLLKPGKIVKANNGYSPDPYLDVKCPLLSAMMAMTEYNGNARATATVMFFCEDGRTKVRINNRSQDAHGWLTVDSCEDCWEQIETALREDKIDWRPANKSGRKW